MAAELIIGILIGIVLMIIAYFAFLQPKIKNLNKEIDKLRFDFRSKVVTHGQSWEQFVPFMTEFEKISKKENFTFIGMPIDGISFDEDSIKFIEIKTGTSQLNKKQKHVRDLVKEKKVEWFELRF